MTGADWHVWARGLARDHEDIAMVVRFEPAGGTEDTHHVCLVMKDGRQASFFAAGKGIEGLAWESVPGRGARAAILADPRLRRPGLHVSMSFCDARALVFTYPEGQERMAGEEIVGAPYRLLHPAPEHRPALDEFYLLWGEPLGPGAPAVDASPDADTTAATAPPRSP
jgi:hypothetical protein